MSMTIEATVVFATLMALLFVNLVYVFTAGPDGTFYHKELNEEIKLFRLYRKIEKRNVLYPLRKCYPLSELPKLHDRMEWFFKKDLNNLYSLKLAKLLGGGFFIKLGIFMALNICQLLVGRFWPLWGYLVEVAVVIACLPILKWQSLTRKKIIDVITNSYYIVNGRTINFAKLFSLAKTLEFTPKIPFIARLHYYARESKEQGNVIFIPAKIAEYITYIKDDELQEFVSSELFTKARTEGSTKYKNDIKDFREKWHSEHKKELEEEELNLAIHYKMLFVPQDANKDEVKERIITNYKAYIEQSNAMAGQC